MTPLVIRFIDEPGAVSRAITFVTNSIWCHVEALNRTGTGWTGAHAGAGVETRALNWCRPIRELRYAVQVKPEAYNTAHDFLESQIGVKYDYLDILGLMLHKRTWLPHRAICSELMLEFMQAGGLLPLNVLPSYDALITPETLHLSPLFIGKSVPNT